MKFSSCAGQSVSIVLVAFFLVCCSAQHFSVRRIIHSDAAPGSTLPLSQAVQVDNLVYVSGTLGMDVNGTMMTGIANQTRMALDNIGHVLREAQSGFDKAIKMTVLLSDMVYYDDMNLVYGEYFSSHFPARVAYQVGRLPRDALIEIEAIAIAGDVIDVESK